MANEVAEVADKMLEVMPEDKWIKGDLYDRGKMCILGAYGKAVHDDAYFVNTLHVYACEQDQILTSIAEVIRSQFPERANMAFSSDSGSTIWKFNDNERTTYDDVRLVLEKVRAG